MSQMLSCSLSGILLSSFVLQACEEEPEGESTPDPAPEYTPAGRALKQKMYVLFRAFLLLPAPKVFAFVATDREPCRRRHLAYMFFKSMGALVICRARLRARQKDRLLRSRETQAQLAQDEKGTEGSYEPEKSPALDLDIRPAAGQISLADASGGPMLPSKEFSTGARSGLHTSTELSVSTNESKWQAVVINVERSRKGNVSYPQRVYTVPGIPVSHLPSIPGKRGLPFPKTSDLAQPPSRESETAASDTGRLLGTNHRDDTVILERVLEQDFRQEFRRPPSVSATLQASLRQLLPQSSRFPFGSSQQTLRPPPLLFESSGRSFGQSVVAAQSQAALIHLASHEVSPSGLPRPVAEEKLHGPGEVLGGLPEFHGLGSLEYQQRSFGRHPHSTGLLVCPILYALMCNTGIKSAFYVLHLEFT